jgi:hypothetical protein
MIKKFNDFLHISLTNLLVKQRQNDNKQYQMPTRISNNSVENYFKIVKPSVLNKSKAIPSIISSLFYNRLQMKYFQFYENIDIHKGDKKDVHVEKWNKPNPNLRKEKGY